MQWRAALIQIKNHCTGNEYLDVGQGKKTEDTKFTMNCVSRLSIKVESAYFIGKLKTAVLLPVGSMHKSVLQKLRNSRQTFKLKFMFKKKTRKLSHIFCKLKNEQLKEFFCFVLPSRIRDKKGRDLTVTEGHFMQHFVVS